MTKSAIGPRPAADRLHGRNSLEGLSVGSLSIAALWSTVQKKETYCGREVHRVDRVCTAGEKKRLLMGVSQGPLRVRQSGSCIRGKEGQLSAAACPGTRPAGSPIAALDGVSLLRCSFLLPLEEPCAEGGRCDRERSARLLG